MKSLDKVIEASEEHKEKFIEVFAKAFFEDPLFLAIFKNPEYRKKNLNLSLMKLFDMVRNLEK